MKILHVSDDISSVTGGVANALRSICEISIINDLSVSVVHTSNSCYDLPEKTTDFCVQPSHFLKFWKFSFSLYSTIEKEISQLNPEESIIHVHGIWNAPQYFAFKLAHKYNIPLIISFHGMLSPWLWNKQGIMNYTKKVIYWNLLIKNKLKNAQIFHAITDDEKQIIEKYLPNKINVAVINNFVINHFEDKINVDLINLKHSILFLGRIHKIKGIELLIDAFIESNLPQKWKLVICGFSGDENYSKNLKNIVNEINCKNLKDRIVFKSPVFGEEKFRLLSESWVLVAPSYSEVMGLVNLESSSVNLPSITSHNVGLKNWEEGGGILINPTVKEIKAALIEVCSWTKSERVSNGVKSKEFYEANYSEVKTAKKWVSIYNSMLKG